MLRFNLLARLVASAGALLGAAAITAQQPATPVPGAGLDLINERCGSCHTTNQVFATNKTAAEWPGLVQAMIDRGAELSPEEQKVVSDYVVAHVASDRKDAGGAGH